MKRSETVRVWLLGGFKVSIGPRTITEGAWRLRKAAALVKLLALSPGHRLHREQVMDLLWPDAGKKAASNNLRKTLHAARRTLDSTAGSRYLASDNESLKLCPGGDLWIDVEAFEEAAATARRTKDPAAYRAALDLYTDDLLPEDRYEEWAETRRQELRRLHLSLLTESAGLYEVRGEHERGIEALQKVVTEEPTLEAAHVGLMRLHALSGRRRDALQQYERLREVLARELGAEPDKTTQWLREDIAAGRFPPVQPAGPSQEGVPDATKHNLPATRDSFVGRERELIEIKRALAMTRLLTLTGAGGSGKTRLALEVARNLVASCPDGVWLVELAPLTEGALVPQAVAGALGVQEQPGQPLVETLAEALRSKEMLMVLDNCEHLVTEAAQLVDVLLDSCLRLRILATSREALDVAGEVRWTVPPLSVPDLHTSPTVEELEGSESARLFAERARQRDPSFALRPDNAQSVGAICRKLDGIPLAVELAAARVGTLAVREVARMLEDSLDLLTSGSRTAVSRQRTLRGALDWSHELLGEPEQILFRRLSTFAGGWALEAAKTVGSGNGVAKGNVLDLLSGLVDKSLVVTETAGDGALRYRMLEPVRQYAREKLEESGEAREVRGRHAKFFLELAQEAETKSWGSEEAAWLERLEAEHDNLRVALLRTLEQYEAEMPLRLAGALSWFWLTRGHTSEGEKWLEEALAKGGAATTTARAGALYGLGDILRRRDTERSQACLEEALALYEGLGDRGRVAQCLLTLGWVAHYQSDVGGAVVLYEEGLATARELDQRRSIPGFLTGLGYIAFDSGDFERAQELWGEALKLEQELGSTMGASGVLFDMGYTELARGDLERATTLLEEALSLGQELRDKWLAAGGLLSLGIAATLRGEPEQAKSMLKECLAMVVELGDKPDSAEALEALAEVAGELGQHARAARLWGAAGALREDIGVPWRPAERMLHEPKRAAARSRLDEALWETAFAEGQAMGLEKAVEYALSDEKPTAAAPNIPEGLSTDARPPAALTRREEEVAVLVAQGLTNRQISSELSISEHTAATHVRRILKKLGLHSRSQLSAWITEREQTSSDLG